MGLNEFQKKERSEYLEKNLKITEHWEEKGYVFISYASDNWEKVFKEGVVPLQQEFGLRVYSDKAFDKENDEWTIPMFENIRDAKAVIAFISQSYIESYACFLELLTAVNNNVKIVFVFLDDNLKHGDANDHPEIGQSVKEEIILQGDDLATKTKSTSKDIMRAMKSGYTTLFKNLKQDLLSKNDISHAFINFFHYASVNRKTLNDLKALMQTINSVSKDVFDVEADTPAPIQPGKTVQPIITPSPMPPYVGGSGQNTGKPVKPAHITPKNKKIIIIAAVLAVVIAIIIILMNVTGHSTVTDMIYNLAVDDDVITVTYTGEWKNGKPDGQGSCTFGNNANNYAEYVGLWENGTLKNGKIIYLSGNAREGDFINNKFNNGQGTESWYDENGNVTVKYVGAFINNNFDGQGTMTWYDENGNVTIKHVGDFINNKLNGQGTTTWYDENGKVISIYKGEYQDDKRNGQGTKTDYDENGKVTETYKGEFKNNYRNGQGTLTEYDENGNFTKIYAGEFKNGTKNGQGTSTWYDENGKFTQTYEGEFNDDKINGQGTYTRYDENGNVTIKYVGEVKDDKRNGQGTYTWYDENGNVTIKYVGEVINNIFNGQGTMIWYDENGKVISIYEGEYQDNKKNGQGTQTDYDENGNVTKKQEGEFKDGEFVS